MLLKCECLLDILGVILRRACEGGSMERGEFSVLKELGR